MKLVFNLLRITNIIKPACSYLEQNIYVEAKGALRIAAILTFFNGKRIKVSIAGYLNMPLEDLEEIFIFEKDMVMKIRSDQHQNTPWYYRI